ncbi:formate dehydrogenase-N subunit alpha [Acetobacteraceae bacterium]|nr:formate dehydrogenase-N subunit alpha [Acetobacteraceae bacterium]
MTLKRRQFLRGAGVTAVGTGVVALGFKPPFAHALETREYKLSRAKQTRNNCCYCSVGCGLLMYTLGDGAINAKGSIFHIEGDPDHPVSRGSLCPKGAGLIDFIHSESRLKYPSYRAPGSTEWKRMSWDEATDRIARLIKEDRDKNFITHNEKGQLVNRWTSTGMLASSAASNETGTLDWKFARSLGILALDNQARTCHAPTVSGLGSSFGRGAMTNNWVDIKNANVVLIFGGNAAEAHPVGFKWVTEARLQNKAKIVVVDPRFNRTAAVADFYAPVRVGSDAAFILGMMNYLFTHDKIQHDYVRDYTNASFIVKPGFSFKEGLFSGHNPGKTGEETYDKSSWDYDVDASGHVLKDRTLKHPRCVLSLLKEHAARYTPEVVSEICGTPIEDFLEVCKIIAETSAKDKTTSWLYALGFTHHTNGSQTIRCAAMIQLLLGNMGMPGGGVNALRGHSNIQGYSDIGLLSVKVPGYMDLPRDTQQTLEAYYASRPVTPDALNQVDVWKNFQGIFVSFLKSMWGDHATKENLWGYHWLPKWDKSYDVLQMVENMLDGKMNGLLVQGFNGLGSWPDKNRTIAAFSKLKFMVVMDPLNTETANFWKKVGEYNDVDSAAIPTEVFRLPTTCFAEEDGSIVNSARWLQWHWKGAEPPGESWPDARIIGTIFNKVRKLYEEDVALYKQGKRKVQPVAPEPILNLTWDYLDPEEPSPEELAKESNGYALADLKDSSGKIILRKGQLLRNSLMASDLRDDGTTSAFNWCFTGSWTEEGNQMARRDNTDTGWGCTPGWAWSWPGNVRLLYSRASADINGVPWDPKRQYVYWNGRSWAGADAIDFPQNEPPGSLKGPFITTAEGVGRLFCGTAMVDGPFPEHYEPVESPVKHLPFRSKNLKDPAVRFLPSNRAEFFGTSEEFPHTATTYSITELFRTWTKHALINAILQPEQFFEIPEELANSLGIAKGDMVRLTSKRGYITGKAVVTKRLSKLKVMGKSLYQIGIPSNFGFIGATKPAFMANTLTPPIGDANTHTPEFKAFLVNLEKI